jgi:hypothetical protein
MRINNLVTKGRRRRLSRTVDVNYYIVPDRYCNVTKGTRGISSIEDK